MHLMPSYIGSLLFMHMPQLNSFFKSFRRTIEVYIHALVLILEPSQRQEAMLRYNPT
jgi:hypothetical protein